MEIIENIRGLRKRWRQPVVAIGVFDGVHRGHQKLIGQAVRRAKKLRTASMVLTFSPHPVQVLRPEVQFSTLVSLPYRLKLIERLGVDACIVIRFTRGFSQLSPEKFIKHYLIDKIKAREIFVGYDFLFGRNRSGDLETLQRIGQQANLKLNVMPAVKSRHKAISSTLIRNLIAEGKIYQASRLLGRRVSILGKVCKGDARGKTLGFPTANLTPQCEVIPPGGVYAAEVVIGAKRFIGMANIGRRPSFKDSSAPLNIEVHIFDFRKNIYQKEIIVEFIKKIRDEKIFNSKEALIEQLRKDEGTVKKLFFLHRPQH
ncbi:MAG: bifunctional riboflavin kinase/FAD synthetase [Candidatus Omnitrophota bacterium]